MPRTPLNILLIEAQAETEQRVRAALSGSGIPPLEIVLKGTLTDGLVALTEADYDLVLVDLHLPDAEARVPHHDALAQAVEFIGLRRVGAAV